VECEPRNPRALLVRCESCNKPYLNCVHSGTVYSSVCLKCTQHHMLAPCTCGGRQHYELKCCLKLMPLLKQRLSQPL
jgi:hypothetical protein